MRIDGAIAGEPAAAAAGSIAVGAPETGHDLEPSPIPPAPVAGPAALPGMVDGAPDGATAAAPPVSPVAGVPEGATGDRPDDGDLDGRPSGQGTAARSAAAAPEGRTAGPGPASPTDPQAPTAPGATLPAETTADPGARPFLAPAQLASDGMAPAPGVPADRLNGPERAPAIDAGLQRGPTSPPAVSGQIAVQIARAAHDGADHLVVQLRPQSLGRIRIELEVAPDNRVIAVIGAERPETLDLLQRDARGLERALNEAGLRADSGSLSFNLRSDGDSRPEAPATPTRLTVAATDDGRAPAPQIYPLYDRSGTGGVDIRV
jgi:hypothetical protein